MHQGSKFILFWNDTLHISDGLCVHHHQFKTVNTATGICETDTAVCLLAGPMSVKTKRCVSTLISGAKTAGQTDLCCLLFYSKLPVKVTFHLAEL